MGKSRFSRFPPKKFYNIDHSSLEEHLNVVNNGPSAGSFLFRFFNKFTQYSCKVSGIRTRIVRIEREHAEQFITTTAHLKVTISRRDKDPIYVSSGLIDYHNHFAGTDHC